MIHSGTPVTVDLFQWISEYGVKIGSCFDPASRHYLLINNFINGSKTFDEMAEDEKIILYDFLRWFFLLCLVFDGGLFTDNVQRVAFYDDYVLIYWKNNIHHRLSLAGWDRATRKAINYIGFRLCSIDRVCDDIASCLKQFMSFLVVHNDQLKLMLDYSNQYLSMNSNDLSNLLSDRSMGFLMLSSLPNQQLMSFYREFSSIFDDELSLEADQMQVPLRAFFAQEVTSDLILLDKVKMHYNVVFFSGLDNDLKQECNRFLIEKVLMNLKDQVVSDYVNEQMKMVCKEQFQPRYDLISMVATHFNWPK